MRDVASLKPPPLGLYVHLPWCVQKCPYCDFNSHAVGTSLPESIYRNALLDDLAQELLVSDSRLIKSVFFGGGTPSLFSTESIAAVLNALRDAGRLAQDTEITLEANPGASDAGRFRGYRRAGVNRISIGAQSFDDAQLRTLGRIHDSREIESAFAAAREAGFLNINLDIMHGLPDQTVETALRDLQRAIRLQPEHISWYQLTLEPGTPFHHRPPPLPDDELRWSIQEQGQRVLRRAGYRQYEVSAWARKGRRCRHNLNYWRFGDYLGIGAGAHGKVTQHRKGIQRRVKPRLPQRYLSDPLVVRMEPVTASDGLCFEYLMNALRLYDGFSLRQFEQRTGVSAEVLMESLAPQFNRGLLRRSGTRVLPTALGRRFLDSMLGELLPEVSPEVE